MRHYLLQQTIILTLLTGVVGMVGGCASATDNQAVVCDPAVEGSCVVSYDEPDKHLAQDFAAYETAYLPTGSAGAVIDNQALVQQSGIPVVAPEVVPAPQLIASSEPAETTGVSVAEKQAQQQLEALQKQVDAQAAAQAQQLAEAEATALNDVMTQVAAAPVYYDPTTGQYVAGPVADGQIVATEQSFVTQDGMLVGGNDLNGQIVAAAGDAAAQPVAETQQAGETVSKAPVEETVIEEVVEAPLEQRILFGEDVQDWDAPAGDSLRALLMQWGEQSGWTVIWKLDRDYTLEAGVVFRGTFMEAASAFIRSFARATPAPIGTFYKGNRVLVVDTQEDDDAH